MPDDIDMQIILLVKNCVMNLFYFISCPKKPIRKTYKIRKHEKRTFSNQSDSLVCISPQSKTSQCASQLGVKLCGVMHTAESKFSKVQPSKHAIFALYNLSQGFLTSRFSWNKLWSPEITCNDITLWILNRSRGNLYSKAFLFGFLVSREFVSRKKSG